MKKLSEVCKIVGITRRALQGYAELGLVKPTSKTESGYWLYDDAAIRKLMLIQIFVEGGYDRKTIKALFESPERDLITEFDCLIESLEAKRKRIDGRINTIKILKSTFKLPIDPLKTAGNLDVLRVYQNKSFSSNLEDWINHSAGFSDEVVETCIPFSHNLIAIGSFLGTPPGAEPVQIAVEKAYKCMEMAWGNDSEKLLHDSELPEVFEEIIQSFSSDLEFRQVVELLYGHGAMEYIVQAAQIFSEKAKDNLLQNQKGVE